MQALESLGFGLRKDDRLGGRQSNRNQLSSNYATFGNGYQP